MKTLVLAGTNESILLETDDTPITLLDNRVIVGAGMNAYTISDRDKTNVRVYEYVTAPDDWFSYKYTFDGQSWAPNPDFYRQQTQPE